MNFWTALFLGIVQGLTEFLPVSSSGHLAIFENLFGLRYSEDENLMFEVLLHLGTLVSVFLVYRKEIIPMVRDTWHFITGKGNRGKTEDGRVTVPVRTMILVAIGTVPLILILPLHSALGKLFGNLSFIALALLVTGTILYAANKIPSGKKDERSVTAKDILLIGAAQAVAVIPGISRSGATTSVGIARGLKRDFAVRFSFLLSIPAVIGAFLLELIKAFVAGVNWALFPLYLVGMVVSAVVGYFAIGLMRRFVERMQLTYFSYYCWGVGVIVLIVSMFV